MVEELRVHQIELEMQGEELRRACEELDDAKTVFEDLYDFAPVGYITLDEHHLISRLNFLAARLLGETKGAFVGNAVFGVPCAWGCGSVLSPLQKVFGRRETRDLRIETETDGARTESVPYSA